MSESGAIVIFRCVKPALPSFADTLMTMLPNINRVTTAKYGLWQGGQQQNQRTGIYRKDQDQQVGGGGGGGVI